MAGLVVSERIIIPEAELEESFSRSSGPGGQHVNKTSTQAELRWNPGASAVLSTRDRAYLLGRLRSQLTQSGDLVVKSSATRVQSRNRADARTKLAHVVRRALMRPKRRVRTRPSRGSIERRLTRKKSRAELKSRRKRPTRDDGR